MVYLAHELLNIGKSQSKLYYLFIILEIHDKEDIKCMFAVLHLGFSGYVLDINSFS